MTKFKNKYLLNNSTPFVLLFFVGVILTTVYIVYGYRSIFHSDSATVNLLLREQIFSKEFFPHDWVYGQDVWVAFINNFMLLVRPLVHDELLLRSMGVIFQSVLLGLVVFIMLKKVAFKYSSIFLVLSLLFSGVSNSFLENTFGQAAYGNTILWILIMLFLVFNALIFQQEKRKFTYFVLIFVLNILLSSSGVRYFGVLTAPLVITLFLFNMLESNNEIYHLPYKKYFIYVLTITFSTILGLLIFKYAISHSLFVKGLSSPVFVDIDGIKHNFYNYCFGMLVLVGALPRAGQSIISIGGIMASYRIIFYSAIMFVVPTYMALRYYKLKHQFSKILLLFYITSFVINTYIYIFGTVAVNMDSSRYFNNNLLMALILIGIYYEEFIYKQKKDLIIFCLCMLLPFYIFAYKDSITNYVTLDKNPGRMVLKQNAHEAIKDYLIKEQLKFGYASYWNSGVISVLSNYKVEVAPINLGSWTPFKWLSSTRWFKDDHYHGDTFILLQGEEKQLNRALLYQFLGEPIKILYKDDYEILVFKGNIAKVLPGWS